MALPDYLQDTGKDLARQMTATYSAPLDTSTFMGSQFVAGQDPAQTAAYNLATQGVGSYQPYLQAAQAGQTAALGATGAGVQALGQMDFDPSRAKAFMDPYQEAVTQDALREIDRQSQMANKSRPLARL